MVQRGPRRSSWLVREKNVGGGGPVDLGSGVRIPPAAPFIIQPAYMVTVRFLGPLFLLLGGILQPACAQTAADSSNATQSATVDTATADWVVLPFASYAPATKLAGGVVAGYYLPAEDGTSPSSIQVMVKGTQRRQLVAQIESELYLAEGRWRVQGEVLGSKYPDVFYGIGGDTPPAAEESYTAQYGVLDLAAQRRLRPNLRIGPEVFVRLSSIREPDDGGTIDRGLVPGSEGGLNGGVGISGSWDARDSIYYPTTGVYGELISIWYSKAWGSDHTFARLTTDLRGYRSAGPGIVAGQVYGEATVGQAPFTLLPSLGGADQMRGYRQGRFRDNVYWTLQAEYRLPLFWRLKGTVFAAAGEVGPRLGPELFEGTEAAVGLGGRFRFTDDALHGRLDIAYSRTGVELYIAVGEAF